MRSIADLLTATDGRSLVLITHRLVGLESVDEILVMDDGRVVERGTHDALLGRDSQYSRLWWDEMRTGALRHLHGAIIAPPSHCLNRRAPPPVAPRTTGAPTMTTDLARWQFATTSIYHFLFVPVTIGLAFLVALLQTSWYRNDNPTFKRLTKFFGTLLLINVAVGVVTGLVQEFEFGMNWSNYSRFVGNIFGGPLAMEGLVAFFLESTFLGVWIFGWDRLSKKAAPGLHLAGGGGDHGVGPVHHGGQLVDAAPGGLRDERPAPAPAQRRLGPVHQPGVPVGLPARGPGLPGHRGHRHAGRLRLAPPAEELGRGLPPHRRHLPRRAGPGGLREHVHRQRARAWSRASTSP